jgi:hypothetical protein
MVKGVWPKSGTDTAGSAAPLAIGHLVTIFLVEEDFLRPGLSSVSLRRSLSLSLQPFLCLDFDLSRPEPEESEPTKDIDKDLRRDSQILTE